MYCNPVRGSFVLCFHLSVVTSNGVDFLYKKGIIKKALVVELEYTRGLGPRPEKVAGSNPAEGTKNRPIRRLLFTVYCLLFTVCCYYSLTAIFLFFSLSIFGILIVKIPFSIVASALELSTSAGRIISLENLPQ